MRRMQLLRRPLLMLLAAMMTTASVVGCSPSAEELHAVGRTPAAGSVLEEADGTGVQTSRAVFDSSAAVVVSAGDTVSQGQAASYAIALRAPMLTMPASGEESDASSAATRGTAAAATEVTEEISRLGAKRVLVVGAVEVPSVPAEQLLAAPQRIEDAGEVVEGGFGEHRDIAAAELGAAVAAAERNPLLCVVDDGGDEARGDETGGDETDGGAAGAGGTGGGAAGCEDAGESAHAAARADYDGPQLAPQEPVLADSGVAFLVTDDTPVAAIATARASGAALAHLPAADPRADADAVTAVTNYEQVVALGPGWGADFAERLEQARTVEQLPGGGQVLFPGRRMVALYGSPITPALGVLGEQDPQASVARVQQLVEQYQPFSPEPIVPAFEIIGTVASQDPGPDGNYTNEWDPQEFVPLVDAITEAGGYAVIDLQPGRARFLDQVQPFRELLKRPGVGLALDPEWKLADGQQPGAQVGSVSAAEINEVTQWLADLVVETGGPQKLLVLHQFQAQMISDRQALDTSREQVALLVHADGHGTAEEKFTTWEMLLRDLPPGVRMAWKNFYDEDTPTFTPEQTMAVEPRPWFVSYQ